MADPETATAVVRRYLDAWQAGDLTTVLDSYHPDLAVTWPGTHALAGEHAGLDAALTALAELQSRTRRELVATGPAVERPDGDVVVDVTERWSCPHPIDVSRSLTFRVLDGRIRGCAVVEGDPALVDRLLG